MKPLLKIIASVLLFINGIGAIIGGYNLLTAPDGTNIGLTLQMLKYSPFDDYFIPGLILFIINGLFSFFVFIMLFIRYRHYAWYIIAQGIVLTCWIMVQVIMLKIFVILHLVMGLTGILLIITGWGLTRIHRSELKERY